MQAEQKQNFTISTPFRVLNNSALFAKHEKIPEQSQAVTTSAPFQSSKDLPTPSECTQCVLHKHEILICGSAYRRACYSYHTLKNEYKFICSYPRDVTLSGHCVVKLVDNRNEITLLSFGGNKHTKMHTLIMKYVSVWSNDNDNGNEMNDPKKSKKSKKSNNLNNYNQWVTFRDNSNNPIIIGENEDDDEIGDENGYEGARAVIGGSNNHLLFITYYPKNISVFDLNTFQFIKHDSLPTNYTRYHCFVSKSENEQEKNKNYKMLLFCDKKGLSIEYNEDNNSFQFNQLRACNDVTIFNRFAYICINDIILFFGGYGWEGNKYVVSKLAHKYSIQENTWTTFEHTLPIPLYNCFGILNENNNYIHIIGGSDTKRDIISTHIKTKLNIWRDSSELSKDEIKLVVQNWVRILKIKLGWIDDFDKIIIKYSKLT
ncbi:hypothetical protein RFI_29498 [Reticulomyxa filosa]|uniref:Kelch motif family protein n=1 Tax=Reticulomyxa filosa TaxID=46433 RepID=X6M355_RETFI|nr:hypothetical protein RFI_29498 [Reticulomyxa filosa]|eukprot:ETO07892.1 hypothetical protein RFI_29498 [Reticulomyxa filosa]